APQGVGARAGPALPAAPERTRAYTLPMIRVPHSSPSKPAVDASERRDLWRGLRHPSGLEPRKFPHRSDQEPLGSLPRAVRLAFEIAVARAAGRLSRLAGAGGGTTVPGKLLWKVDPGAVDRLAARLPLGSALISATNGKTTTAAMAAEIL